MSEPAAGAVTVVLLWILLGLIIALWFEDHEGTFLYPGKNKGERGIITVCRWAFIIAFSPVILVILSALVLVKLLVPKIPEATRGLIKWLIEKK